MPITSIPLPSIKFAKKKERSQICEIFTDDGRLADKEEPVANSCAKDDTLEIAWLLVPENQFMAEDGNWHQLVSEHSQIPICLIKESKLQDGDNDEAELDALSNDLYIVTFWQKMTEGIMKAKRGDALNKMQVIVGMICGTIILIGGLSMLGGR